MPVRDQFVRVRLVPAHLGHAVQVKLAIAEREALLVAMREKGYGELSTFIRTLGVAAGVQYHQRAAAQAAGDTFPRQVIEWAAEAAHMNVGEWMRTVALAAIGFSPLCEHLTEARKAFEAGLKQED